MAIPTVSPMDSPPELVDTGTAVGGGLEQMEALHIVEVEELIGQAPLSAAVLDGLKPQQAAPFWGQEQTQSLPA